MNVFKSMIIVQCVMIFIIKEFLIIMIVSARMDIMELMKQHFANNAIIHVSHAKIITLVSHVQPPEF